MKISERIKSLFRRQPPTAEELAARAEADRLRDEMHANEALLQPEIDAAATRGANIGF